MTEQRYDDLMRGNEALTAEEIAEGYHFCDDWDGLLIGADDEEITVCSCYPANHKVYRNKERFNKAFEEAMQKPTPFDL